MGLRQLVSVVILIIQLYKVEAENVRLPLLRHNKLFENDATNLPGEHVNVSCGATVDKNARIGTRKSISQALTTFNFGRYGFTSGPLGSLMSPSVSGIQGTFKFTPVTAIKTILVLTVDPEGDPAYWLPQGGVIDIPKHPNDQEPKYVFTTDFSGCSWTVTPMDNGYLRIRHVTGGQEGPQFNDLPESEKGGNITYAMQYVDYGYNMDEYPVVQNRRAYAYMHYTEGWQFHLQRQTCMAIPGGYEFHMFIVWYEAS